MTQSEEIKCQYEALNTLSHGDKALAEKYVKFGNYVIAQLFREIITGFEEKESRVPTGDDLIWCASERLGFNLRELEVGSPADYREEG